MAASANENGVHNESSYILETRRSYPLVEERAASIDSTENAFDDMKQLIDDDDDETANKSTLPWASFNFINSIIGSGVIGIPYALHEAGFGFGLVLLVMVAYVTDYSLVLMVRSGHISGRFSYQGVMEAAFGRPGYVLLGVLQFFYPFIAMVSYNVVVGDTVTKVIIRLTGIDQDSIFAKRHVIVLIATIFITVPLCLYRKIAKLAKISFISLVCIGFILFSISVRIGTMSEIVLAQKFLKASNGILFVQISLSAVIVCNTLFLLHLARDNQTALFLLAYQLVVTSQIFMFCWFGNEVTLKSANIFNGLCVISWYELPLEVKKDLLFFLMRTRRPIILRVGGMISLDLITFKAIIKSSWAYFTAMTNATSSKI